jgi:hypothetical protein
MSKYLKDCILETPDDLVEAEIHVDGLLVEIELGKIAELLEKHPSGRQGWYFNKSKDRYIAERLTKNWGKFHDPDEIVLCNPMLFVYHGWIIHS